MVNVKEQLTHCWHNIDDILYIQNIYNVKDTHHGSSILLAIHTKDMIVYGIVDLILVGLSENNLCMFVQVRQPIVEYEILDDRSGQLCHVVLNDKGPLDSTFKRAKAFI